MGHFTSPPSPQRSLPLPGTVVVRSSVELEGESDDEETAVEDVAQDVTDPDRPHLECEEEVPGTREEQEEVGHPCLLRERVTSERFTLTVTYLSRRISGPDLFGT